MEFQPTFVTSDRYNAEHHEMVRRLEALEGATAHAAVVERRVDELESKAEREWTTEATDKVESRRRRWALILAVVTSLVAPLAVLGVLSLIHLLARS